MAVSIYIRLTKEGRRVLRALNVPNNCFMTAAPAGDKISTTF